MMVLNAVGAPLAGTLYTQAGAYLLWSICTSFRFFDNSSHVEVEVGMRFGSLRICSTFVDWETCPPLVGKDHPFLEADAVAVVSCASCWIIFEHLAFDPCVISTAMYTRYIIEEVCVSKAKGTSVLIRFQLVDAVCEIEENLLPANMKTFCKDTCD
jgi:hypothetical protein